MKPRSLLLPIVVLVLGLLLLRQLDRWGARLDVRYEAWVAHVDSLLGPSHDRYVALRDSLRLERERHAREAQEAGQRAQAVLQRANTLEVRLRALLADTTVVGLRAALDTSLLVIVELRGALAEKDTKIGGLTAQLAIMGRQALEDSTRIAELEETLAEGVEVTQCRILGVIKCPSRTVVFAAGILGGFVLGEVLSPHQ